MTPKEKAKELVKKYALLTWKGKEFDFEYYKKCALIAVDEIIKQENTIVPQLMKIIKLLYINKNMDYKYKNDMNIFWQEVKTQIEKL